MCWIGLPGGHGVEIRNDGPGANIFDDHEGMISRRLADGATRQTP